MSEPLFLKSLQELIKGGHIVGTYFDPLKNAEPNEVNERLVDVVFNFWVAMHLLNHIFRTQYPVNDPFTFFNRLYIYYVTEWLKCYLERLIPAFKDTVEPQKEKLGERAKKLFKGASVTMSKRFSRPVNEPASQRSDFKGFSDKILSLVVSAADSCMSGAGESTVAEEIEMFKNKIYVNLNHVEDDKERMTQQLRCLYTELCGVGGRARAYAKTLFDILESQLHVKEKVNGVFGMENDLKDTNFTEVAELIERLATGVHEFGKATKDIIRKEKQLPHKEAVTGEYALKLQKWFRKTPLDPYGEDGLVILNQDNQKPSPEEYVLAGYSLQKLKIKRRKDKAP